MISAAMVDQYCMSAFSESAFCSNLSLKLNDKVKNGMLSLADKGALGAIAARIISPFVGVGTLLAALCLHVGSIAEPIVGILADLFVAMISCSARTLVGPARRVVHLFRNLAYNTAYIVRDILLIGVVAGVGGILAPQAAYGKLPS